MSDHSANLNEAEQDAERTLSALLEGPLRLAHDTHLAIGDVVDSLHQHQANRARRAVHVVVQLLNRASNDLRCATQNAQRGYPAQSATIVSSLYESALTAAYIGSDETLANEWLSHERTDQPFRSARTLAEVIGRGDKEKTKQVYAVYQGLCMPKHINPIVESQMGVRIIDGVPFLRNGPDTSEFARHVAFFSLVMGCRLIVFSVAPIADALLDRVAIERLHDPLVSLVDECRRLDHEEETRWRASQMESAQ